mmetsp:Transcript_19134/g.26485  ORF Transcript_19134/g.26485 Transcript_19134/m.26485 type:complete len:217 (+) Transcript_19134:423-1073(+)|eukprot:CAMPEP_0196579684 /NCGR_PEP_ID=MMETSP1081-20130531/24451_1 /TAXON_ID=36882 /ORGANISM="Pyramimonas amylifera, Strain CCMP720" /LENGTH=216 /DNA_ID=CAMNT_0041899337 /DNA_START=397 /DNA_END=1047 /DNA_ORIENTATION=+
MATGALPPEMLKALSMYGVYDLSQLSKFQQQYGQYCSPVPSSAGEPVPKRRREEPSQEAMFVPTLELAPRAFQAPVQPNQPGMSEHGYHDGGEVDLNCEDDQGDDDMNGGASRTRHYRDPEKRREQNRRASQRARDRARQREDQVIKLQLELNANHQKMQNMENELVEAKRVVEKEKVLAQLRAIQHLRDSASNPNARPISFSHPPLKMEQKAEWD